ncbi:MAG: sigma-70 family RNA polymerase sigma factor [Saprospiraceae bacterium]|nr:sigma-70 family RNA polymerase sigma factor [Saprospiraceae bacterium]
MIDDETLLASILEGGDALHRDMRQYYQESQCRTEVLNLLKKRGASTIEAEDVFQEGIIAFIFNVRKGKYRGEASVKTYIAAIYERIYNNQVRKKKSVTQIEGNTLPDVNDYKTPEYLFIEQEKRQKLDELLAKLGEKCEKILRL